MPILIKRNFKLACSLLVKNYSLLILLFLLPIVIACIGFFTSDNVFLFNQYFAPIISIDLFIIFFLIFPLFIKNFQNSIFIVFNIEKKIERRSLWLSNIIFFFFIASFFLCYSIFIIFIFGQKDLANEIYLSNDPKKVVDKYFQVIFANQVINSNHLGISNFLPKNWGIILGLIFASCIFYACFSIIFISLIKNESNLNFFILIFTFISIANSGFVVNLSSIRQNYVYSIISYFTISIVPLSFLTFYTTGNNDILTNGNIYSQADFDFYFSIMNKSEKITFLLIFIIVLIISFILFIRLSNDSKNKIDFSKIDPYDNQRNNLRIVFQTIRKGDNQCVDLSDGESIILNFANNKEKQVCIKSLYKQYNLFNMLTYDMSNYFGTGVFVSNRINKISQYGINFNMNIFFDPFYNENEFLMREEYKALTKEFSNTKKISDLLLSIVFLLNSNTQFLVVEWSDFFTDELVEKICDLAKQKNKNCIFLNVKN